MLSSKRGQKHLWDTNPAIYTAKQENGGTGGQGGCDGVAHSLRVALPLQLDQQRPWILGSLQESQNIIPGDQGSLPAGDYMGALGTVLMLNQGPKSWIPPPFVTVAYVQSLTSLFSSFCFSFPIYQLRDWTLGIQVSLPVLTWRGLLISEAVLSILLYLV